MIWNREFKMEKRENLIEDVDRDPGGAPDPPEPIVDRTYRMALRVVRLAGHLMQKQGPAQVMARQVLRSGTSVGANVEEAQASSSRRDFASKMAIALREARETLYWLRLIGDAGLADSDRLVDIRQEANEVVSILTVIVRKAKHPATAKPG